MKQNRDTSVKAHMLRVRTGLQIGGHKLYVGNVSYSATEQQIRDLFSQYGWVESLDWLTDRDTGDFRGFLFLEMETESGASAAIAGLDGYDFFGRNLRVNEARPRERRGTGRR